MPAAELEHFTLECGDLKTTRDFYCDVLGLTEGFRPQMDFPGCSALLRRCTGGAFDDET